MATGDGFEVSPETLTTHAAAVDRLAETVDLARRAGNQIRLGRDAYGQLCQIFPALLDPLQEATVTALADATNALHDSAHALRTIAESYTHSDQAASRRIADVQQL